MKQFKSFYLILKKKTANLLHVLSLFVLSTEQLGLLSHSLHIVWIIVHKQCSNDQPTVEDVLFEQSPKNITTEFNQIAEDVSQLSQLTSIFYTDIILFIE